MAFFAVLEDVVNRDPLVRVDDAIFHVLQSLRTAPLDRVMVGITELGDWVVTTAVTLVSLFWLIWRRNRRPAPLLVRCCSDPKCFFIPDETHVTCDPADRSQFRVGLLLLS